MVWGWYFVVVDGVLVEVVSPNVNLDMVLDFAYDEVLDVYVVG